MISHISYSHAAFGQPETLILNARANLKDIEYDTMIGTGLSGALVIPILARALNKHFAIIRKSTETSHSYKNFEGNIGYRWLFVDDFIASGRTLRTVYGTMTHIIRQHATQPVQFIGAYCYDTEFRFCEVASGRYISSEELAMNRSL